MLLHAQLRSLVLVWMFCRNCSLLLSAVTFDTGPLSNHGHSARVTRHQNAESVSLVQKAEPDKWLSGVDDNEYKIKMKEWDTQCQWAGLCHCYLSDMALQYSLFFHGSQTWFQDYDLYEFGVYTGKGIGEKSQFIKKMLGPHASPRHVWGFDSFEGVPRSKDNPSDGLFDVRKINNFTSWSDMELAILKNVEFSNATLIKGFYNETLNQQLVEKHGMKPAWYVNIDCDIYSSTLQALDWMFANQLMRPGTFVYYDDVLGNTKDTGERKAHSDISDRYNVVWKQLLRHNKFFDDEIVTYFYEVVSYQGYKK